MYRFLEGYLKERKYCGDRTIFECDKIRTLSTGLYVRNITDGSRNNLIYRKTFGVDYNTSYNLNTKYKYSPGVLKYLKDVGCGKIWWLG